MMDISGLKRLSSRERGGSIIFVSGLYTGKFVPLWGGGGFEQSNRVMKGKRYEKRDEKGEHVKEKGKKWNDNGNIERKRVKLRKSKGNRVH
jgi:hypothetical protein